MRVITTAELAVLARELSDISGFYIERFYEVSENKFRIKLTKRGEDARNLQIILSHAINETKYIEKAETPSNFSMAIRKRIEGFSIKKIAQLNNDRIIIIELQKGDTAVNMIIEMFGQGNLMITDSDSKIVLAYRNQEQKDRIIRVGAAYKPPKQDYKLEIPENITPVIYREENGKAIDYSITMSSEKHKELKQQAFASLQEALDQFYYENPILEKREKTQADKQREELELSIEKQSRIIANIDKEIESNKQSGKLIFDNMELINQLITAAQSNKRITKEELQRQFPKIKILSLDLKDKKIKIEL